jgi:hypothetical protein
MRQKANPAIEKRIFARAAKRRTSEVKKLAMKGLPPDQIARETGQSVEWVKLTLEDFDPKIEASNDERRKEQAAQTRQIRGSRLGRPPIRREKKPAVAVTVEEVLARYKRIREDFKAGKWETIEEAAEDEGLEIALVTRLIKGRSPVE